MGTNILEFRKITKQFPGALAVKDVDFELRAGEVHALAGEIYARQNDDRRD